MKILSTPLLLCACVVVSACSSVQTYEYLGSSDQELSVPPTAADGIERITLETNRYTGGALVVYRREMAAELNLGLEVREFDKPTRAQLESDLRPFAGLYVQAVEEGGAAEQAGLKQGDLLLRAGGRDLVEVADFLDAAELAGAGQELNLAVLRGPDVSTESKEERVALTLLQREFPVSRAERIPLTSPEPVNPPVLGVRLGGLPAPWNQSLFEDPADPVVITSVVPGSPAYLAGLRSGDLIFRMDDLPTRGMSMFQEWVADAAKVGAPIELQVRRGNGEAFVTALTPEDYSSRGSFYFPLVMNWESDAQDTRWSFGPLGLLAGYRGYYLGSPDRAPRHDSTFSMLLGLLRVEDEGDTTRTRLLWFISWSS